MKVSPEKIIVFSKNYKIDSDVFLISGNEETLIKKTEKTLVKILKKNGFESVSRESLKKINSESVQNSSNQLFFKSEIKVFDNPSEVDTNCFDTDIFEKTAIIISHTSLKANNKLKLFFDKHKSYTSISCYSLNKDKKKLYFDNFINEKNIKIEKDAYWFFIEYSSNIYQIFENEMLKILSFSEEAMNLEEMRLLVSRGENQNFDKLFFLISGNKSRLFSESYNAINSITDSYIFIQRVKFFFNIIVSCNSESEASEAFPKYLFENKATFVLLYKKTNKTKISKGLLLIKKTETMLRKNSNMYLPVTQRFLVNLQKCFV